jgi:uncharacterized membrane protein
MSDDLLNNLKSRRKSKVLDKLAARFAFTVATTLIVAYINKESLTNDPNSLKWLLITIWVDIVAYFMGFLGGFTEGARAVVYTLIDNEGDIIGR